MRENEGDVGYFTKGVIKRKKYYFSGLICFLITFLNKELYFRKNGN
ncbi:hypothetical protein ES703_77129 [subsurface metagenome]